MIDGGDAGGSVLRAGVGAIVPGLLRGKAENLVKGTSRGANVLREGVGTVVDTATNVAIGGGHVDGGTAIDLIGGTVQGRLHGGQQHQAARAPVGSDGHLPVHERTTRPMPAVDVDTHGSHHNDIPSRARTTQPMDAVVPVSKRPTQRMDAVVPVSERPTQRMTAVEPPSERTTQRMDAVVPPSERVTERMPAVEAPIDPVERAWERAAEPQRERPATYTEAIERSAGIDKGAEYQQFRQDMAAFYANQEIEAQNVTRVREQTYEKKKDGNYFVTNGSYDVRTFSYDNGPLTHVSMDAHLRPGAGVTPEQIEEIKRAAFRGTDRLLNSDGSGTGRRHQLPDGSKLHVEPRFVDEPEAAHHVVDVVQADPKKKIKTDQQRWVTDHVLNGERGENIITHELPMHGTNQIDEYFDDSTVNRDREDSPHVAKDMSLMATVEPGARVMPRHLERMHRDIETTRARNTAVASTAASASATPAQADALQPAAAPHDFSLNVRRDAEANGADADTDRRRSDGDTLYVGKRAAQDNIIQEVASRGSPADIRKDLESAQRRKKPVEAATTEEQIRVGTAFKEGDVGSGQVLVGSGPSAVPTSFSQLQGNSIHVKGIGTSDEILREMSAGAKRLGMTEAELAAEIENFGKTGVIDKRIRADKRLHSVIARDVFRQHAVEPVRIPTHLVDRANALQRASAPGGKIADLETHADTRRIPGQQQGAVASFRTADEILRRAEAGEQPLRPGTIRVNSGERILRAHDKEATEFDRETLDDPAKLVELLVSMTKPRLLQGS